MKIFRKIFTLKIVLKSFIKQFITALYYLFSDPIYSLKLFKNILNGSFIGNVSIGNHKSAFYQYTYKEWRKKRIKFLVKVLGKDWFANKKLIEFGSGNGEISNFFKDIGSNVICCEGREELVKDIKRRHPNFETILLDNDTDWDDTFREKQFDLAIHWGLLYHLENWDRDLINVLKIAKIICLESEVFPSNEDFIFKRKEFGHDQSIHNTGTYISSSKIEKIFIERNLKFKRFDSKDLNTSRYKYNWIASDDKNMEYWKRRFWIIWT